jgi:thioredoxin-related protein
MGFEVRFRLESKQEQRLPITKIFRCTETKFFRYSKATNAKLYRNQPNNLQQLTTIRKEYFVFFHLNYNPLKKILLVLFFVKLSFLQTLAQSPIDSSSQLVWHTNLIEAQEISMASKKPIFAFFTGSDWCGWCRKLQNDVFGKPEFVAWARKNVVLLELDFPRRKQLPAELAQQNNSLQQALKVQGFPTIWILFMSKEEATNNFNLSTFGSLGYPQGAELGSEQVKFLEDASKIMALIKAN